MQGVADGGYSSPLGFFGRMVVCSPWYSDSPRLNAKKNLYVQIVVKIAPKCKNSLRFDGAREHVLGHRVPERGKGSRAARTILSNYQKFTDIFLCYFFGVCSNSHTVGFFFVFSLV